MKSRTAANFGKRIVLLRKSMKMSMSDLSKKSGVPPTTLNDIEKGRRTFPRLDTAVAIANALGRTIDWFLKDRKD